MNGRLDIVASTPGDRARRVLESAHEAFVAIDQESVVTDWNPAAETLFGWTRDEALGRTLAETIMPERDREAHRAGMARFLATEEGPVLGRYLELTACRRDGSEFPIELAISAVRDPGGWTFNAFVRDITQRRLLAGYHDALLGATSLLAGCVSLDDAAPRLLDRIGSAAGWSVGALWLPDHDDSVLRCSCFWRAPDVGAERFEAATQATALARGEGLPGHAWVSVRPMWIHDLESDTTIQRVRGAHRDGFRSAIALPLLSGGSVLGVIEFFGSALQQSDDELVRLLTTLGAQIGEFAARTRLQAEARIEREFQAAVLESLKEPVVACDVDGNITIFNRAARELHGPAAAGVSSEDTAKQYDLYRPDGATLLPAEEIPLFRALRGELVRDAELVVARPGQPAQHLLASGRAMYDPDGVKLGAVVAMQDVTERKRVDEERARQAETLGRAQSAAKIGSWELEVDTGVALWSDELYELFGVARTTEPHFALFEQLVHADDRATVNAAVEQVIATGERWTGEYRLIRQADKRIVRIYATAEAVATHDGRPRLAGTVQDVSDLRRAEAAEHANRAKSEFLSRMSHELRTPLNAILGFGQLLQTGELTPAQLEDTSQILSAGRHLLVLVNEVLDLSRIERGEIELELEPVHVATSATEALAVVTPIAARTGVTLHTPASASADSWVLASSSHLKQVLLNLLMNAVKYNRPGGRATISFEDIGSDRVRIVVEDTGPGIAQEALELLFQPFERLGAERTDIEGTGLGLAVAKELVQAMGGRIGVESIVGEGSRFWIELPRERTGERRRESSPDLPVIVGRDTPDTERTVLYIEDNLSNLKLIEHVLAMRPGLEVLSAVTGELGLALATRRPPDLILLDLNLPGMSGEEVLQRLRADPRTSSIPVVVLSADATATQQERLIEAGAFDYVTKPIDIGSFMRVLEDALVQP